MNAMKNTFESCRDNEIFLKYENNDLFKKIKYIRAGERSVVLDSFFDTFLVGFFFCEVGFVFALFLFKRS